MTQGLADVLVPYSRFLECQDRRRRFAAGVTPVDRPPSGEDDALPVPAPSETAALPPPLSGSPDSAGSGLIDQPFNSARTAWRGPGRDRHRQAHGGQE